VDEEHLPSRTDALLVDLFLAQWLQACEQDVPLLMNVVFAADDRATDRLRVGAMLNAAVGDPQLVAALLSFPRENPRQITIVCAVVLDTLEFVVGQLGGEATGVIAVEADDNHVHFLRSPRSSCPPRSRFPPWV